MLFVGYSGGEVNAVAQRKKIPQAIKLKRCAIGSLQRLDKRACGRIIIVDQTVPEIANPEFAINQSKSLGRIEVSV